MKELYRTDVDRTTDRENREHYITVDKERWVLEKWRSGEIKELGHNCWTVPSAAFAMGVTPRIVGIVIERAKITQMMAL